MTRKKVNLAYIANDSARKATFKKRRKGLLKKVNELSTLCAVDACAIIFSPYDNEPEVWPSHLGVQRVIAKFRKMPELEQSKKMVNQEGFTKQRLTRGEEQLRKQLKENRQNDLTCIMNRCLINRGGLQYLSLIDLNDLGYLLNQNIREIEGRIEFINQQVVPQGMKMVNEMGRGEYGNNQLTTDLSRPNVMPNLDGDETNHTYASPLKWSWS